MVTTALDSPAVGLFERLVAGATVSNVADRSQLRPLQSHRFEPAPAFLPETEVEWPLAATSDRAQEPSSGVLQVTATRERPDASVASSVRASPASLPDVSATPPRQSASPHTTVSRTRPAAPHETQAQHGQDPIAPLMPIARSAPPTGMAHPLSAVPTQTNPSDVRQPASQPAQSLPPSVRSLPASHGTSGQRVRSLDDESLLDRRPTPDPAADRTPPDRPANARVAARPQAAARNTSEPLQSRDASPLPPLQRPSSQRAEPTIEIHIGRIEVRAQAAASPPAASTPRASAPTPNALAAHLGARGRGARS